MGTVEVRETGLITTQDLSSLSNTIFPKIIAWARPYGEAGAVGSLGITLTSAGTASTPALANTSLKNSKLRQRLSNGPAIGSYAYIRNNSTTNLANIWRGNAAGLGGFRGRLDFSYGLDTTGARFFAGVTAATGNLLNGSDPSAAVNMFGVGFDVADVSGSNFLLMHNDGAGAATRLDSLIARNTNNYFALLFAAPPNGSYIDLEFLDLTLGTSSGVRRITTELPDSATFLLCPRIENASAALNGTSVVDWSSVILAEY